jgi:hypothetical protein
LARTPFSWVSTQVALDGLPSLPSFLSHL